jgi:hypothetical protein
MTVFGDIADISSWHGIDRDGGDPAGPDAATQLARDEIAGRR